MIVNSRFQNKRTALNNFRNFHNYVKMKFRQRNPILGLFTATFEEAD